MIRPDRWMHHTAVIRPFLRQGVSAPEYGEPTQVKCLLSLGRKELEKLRDEDPHCEVVCHFCHTKYEFDLNKLVKKAVEKAAPASENAEN